MILSLKFRHIILINLLMMGCVTDEKPQYILEPTFSSTKEGLKYTTEEFKVPLDSTYFDCYALYSNYEAENGEFFWAGYNHQDHSLDFLNATKRKTAFKTYLPQDEESGISKAIRSFEVYNWDSIFILTREHLYLTDTAGNIQFQHLINPKDSFRNASEKFMIFTGDDYFPIAYNKQNNQLYLNQYSWFYPFGVFESYQFSVEAAYDLEQKETKALPIPYSSLYRKKDGYYGKGFETVMRLVVGDEHIVSFNVDPNIYVFNVKTNTMKVKGGKSKYHVREIEPYPLVEKENDILQSKQTVESPSYESIYYDEYRNLYYRFFTPGITYKRPDGKYNSRIDKPTVLMVFDTDFTVLGEIKLPQYIYGMGGFISEEGFFLSKMNYKNQNHSRNHTEYTIFKFEKGDTS